jgi:hypothetical protein
MNDRFPQRFLNARELAAFFRVDVRTLQRRRPPKTGLGFFDTWSPVFQKWMDAQLGWEGAGSASVTLPEDHSSATLAPQA